MIEETIPGMMVGVDHAASGMAFGAGRELRLIGGIQVGQAMEWDVLPGASLSSQLDVGGTRPMTSFTSHVSFKEGSGKTLGLRVKAFFQVRGVAIGAHMVPVLHGTGPEERIMRLDVFVGIKVIPLLLFHVPTGRQGLQATIGELHEVLLQGLPTKGVLDLENLHFPFLVFGFHEVFVVLLEKPGGDPIPFKGGSVEVRPHRTG